MSSRRELLLASCGLLGGLAGCLSTGSDHPPGSDGTRSSETVVSTPTDFDLPRGPYHYTHPQQTGNRNVPGTADLTADTPVTFEPPGRPNWLVAHPSGTGSGWTVVATDGTVSTWRIESGTATRVGSPGTYPVDGPPTVAIGGETPALVPRPGATAPQSGMLVSTGAGTGESILLAVAEDGTLVVTGDREHRLDVDALPDGRIAAVGDGRYALFAEPSERYGHGALGDGVEPTALLIVDASVPAVTARASLEPPAVFEALQPLVADLDGDGQPEIVTTVADSADGARIAVFSPAGERLATGPTYGPGWRHQLVAAPLGPNGERELAVVLKPHVTHRLEFYRFHGEGLEVRATLDGFSSHTYRSRIIDGAVAGDFDADGQVEVLVPTTDRRRLAAVRRTASGAATVWQLALDGRLACNVTGVGTTDGGVAIGAATSDGVQVWTG